MRVLSLVTTPDNTFFTQQVESLEALGVTTTVLSVPGDRAGWSGDAGGERSPLDYLRLYPQVLKHSFGDYDLVHANFGLTAPLALAQPRLPVVLSLWGTDIMGRYAKVSRWCARRSDAVVVMSEEMAEAADCPCYVIPHGIDLDRFSPTPQADAQVDLGWDPAAKHVLFPYPPRRTVKNFPRAERIVAAVREHLDTPVELHAVSDVPHERIPVYMNAADVLLLTSDREGSPNSVKEALACNLPVVATDVGDVRDRLAAVTPSTVGRTDDELVEGLVDVLSIGGRSNGRETVADLSLTAMAQQLLDVYETVVDDRRSPIVRKVA